MIGDPLAERFPEKLGQLVDASDEVVAAQVAPIPAPSAVVKPQKGMALAWVNWKVQEIGSRRPR